MGTGAPGNKWQLTGISCIGLLFMVLIVVGGFDAFSKPEIGFVVNGDLVVTSLSPALSASEPNLELGDRIVAINGEPAHAGDRIAEQGRTAQIDQTISYRIQTSDGQIKDVELTWMAPTYQRKKYSAVNMLTALIILGIATYAVFRKPAWLTVKLYYFLCLFYLFFRMEHPRWQGEIWSRIYQVLYLLSFFLIPAVFTHFCGRFPKPNRFLHSRRSFIWWLYAPSCILFVPAAVVNWIHYDNVRATGIITQIILYEGFVLWAVYLIAGSLMMVHAFFRIRSRELSKRCSLVFYTIALAVAPYMIAGFLENFLHRTYLYEIIGLVLFLPFPAILAWAIDFGEDEERNVSQIIEKFIRSRN
jgi:hypothetical protein